MWERESKIRMGWKGAFFKLMESVFYVCVEVSTAVPLSTLQRMFSEEKFPKYLYLQYDNVMISMETLLIKSRVIRVLKIGFEKLVSRTKLQWYGGYASGNAQF